MCFDSLMILGKEVAHPGGAIRFYYSLRVSLCLACIGKARVKMFLKLQHTSLLRQRINNSLKRSIIWPKTGAQLVLRHHDIRHNDTQHNETHHNDTQHNGRALSCRVSRVLSITYKPFMLSVIMINIVMLNVAAPMEHSILYDRGFKTSCYLKPR